MHGCLKLPEILYAICEIIRDSRKLATLASLAMTCKSFKEPALDSLYYELNSFWPLVQCLPRSAWAIKASDNWVHTIFLRRALEPLDINIILKYRLRVRILWLNSVGSRRCHDSVYQAIGLFFFDSIVPNVKRLEFRDPDNRIIRYLRLFAGSNMTYVLLHFGFMDVQTGSLLSSLASRNSFMSLQNLFIHVFADDNPHKPKTELVKVPALYSDISLWRNLRRIHLTRVSCEVLAYVAGLPHLSWLILSRLVGHFCNVASEISKSVYSPFPALQSLLVEGALDKCLHMLPLFHSSTLKEISVRQPKASNRASDIAILEAFLAELERSCGSSPLRTLTISASTRFSEIVVFSDLVAPLQKFSTLKSVKFELRTSLAIFTQDALWIKRSWPNLTKFSVASSPAAPPIRYGDFYGLLLLGTGCPNLRLLQLEFDCRNFEDRAQVLKDFQQGSGFGPQNPSLTNLYVGSSPISHKEFVAMVLSELFPNLNKVSANKLNEDYHRRWRTIDQITVPLLRVTRERVWGVGGSGYHSSKREVVRGSIERLGTYWLVPEDNDGGVSDGHQSSGSESDIDYDYASLQDESEHGE